MPGSGQIEIIFKLENLDFVAELDNSLTAQNIIKVLPMESVVAKWGDEIFFNIEGVGPVSEIRTSRVNVGDVAFCPEGNCLCVFFGPTPASVLGNPIPENPVVIIGRVKALPDRIKEINPGQKVKLSVAKKDSSASEKHDSDSVRKLSQTEIDVLVKQLLEEKKNAQQKPS